MATLTRDVSPIGFGAFKIGRNQGIKYPAGYELPDLPAVEQLLNAVLDCGINYIDTAPAYGASEERIGRTIAHRRKEYLLSTKVGEVFENGASTYDYSRAGVRASVERSLERLRTDRLDLVFVHARRDDMQVVEHTDLVATLSDLRDQGIVARIGLSGYTAPAFRASFDWADAVMLEYHPLDRSLESIIAEAAERGIMVMVKKPLASGRLAAAESLEFVLANAGVTSALVGSLDPAHMKENLGIARRVREKGRPLRARVGDQTKQ